MLGSFSFVCACGPQTSLRCSAPARRHAGSRFPTTAPPLRVHDVAQRNEDYVMIGDTETAALVG
jgi:hypothetical protein